MYDATRFSSSLRYAVARVAEHADGQGGPVGQPKREEPWQLSIRLPREMEPIIRQLAKQRVVPPAVVCRQLIKERLDQLEAESQRGAR